MGEYIYNSVIYKVLTAIVFKELLQIKEKKVSNPVKKTGKIHGQQQKYGKLAYEKVSQLSYQGNAN